MDLAVVRDKLFDIFGSISVSRRCIVLKKEIQTQLLLILLVPRQGKGRFLKKVEGKDPKGTPERSR